MNFEEFREQLVADLKENIFQKTGEEIDVSNCSMAKLQNASYEGITIRKSDNPLGLNIDASRFFSDYESGKADYDEILDNVTDVTIRGFNEAPAFDITSLSDYDVMKEHLSMQVVATERNAEMLANIPHKEIEDMSVVCRFIVTSEKEGIGSILITNEVMRNMGITEEQLFSDANKYAPDLRPGEIRGMADVLAEIMGINESELESFFGVPSDNAEVPMYIATTRDKTNGAGIIAYPGFMEMASEKLGGDFFLLPSSVHEVILIPDKGEKDYHGLEDMVKEVNETQVPPADRLSDNVYHYDSKEKVFELAGKFDARKKEKSAEKKADKDSVLKDLSAEKKDVAETVKPKSEKLLKREEKSL